MEPGVAIALHLMLIFVSSGTGLDLSLDLRESAPLAERPPCVLRCVESYVSANFALGQGQTMNNSSSITSMKIFTSRLPLTAKYENESESGELLASLTLQQPKITRISNDMKIDGHLGRNEASLQIQFFSIRDCSAEFRCELISLDAYGSEIVSRNRFQQQQRESRDQTRVGEFSSEPSRFLMFFQQLDYKLAMLENRLDDRIRSIENKIEIRVADKLCQLEAKLSTCNTGARSEAEDKSISRDSFFNEQKERIVNAVTILERLEKRFNDSYLSASTMQKYIEKMQCLDKTNSSSCNNSSKEAHELPGRTTKCPNDRVKSAVSLQESLLKDMRQLEITTCNSSTDALSDILDEISNTTRLIANNIEAISDILAPKRCRKGAVSNTSIVQTPYPYPLIRPSEAGGLNFSYLCDQTTDGGGWIVIQRRTTGQEDFYRDWATYKEGFGSLAGDFWIGNENLHELTSKANFELQVELKYNGKSAFAHYNDFFVDSEENNYALKLGQYDGTAGDSLIYHNGMTFSTHDNDNAKDPRNCAKIFIGAWWYYSCLSSNLNGKWGAKIGRGPTWHTFSGSQPVSYSEMKIRAVDITEGL